MYNLEDFEAYLIKNRGMKLSSAKSYVSLTKFFLRYAEKEPEKVENKDIIEYLAYLKETRKGENSRRLAKSAIERFFTWYSKSQNLPNPAIDLPVIKEYIRDPRLVSPDEIELLINACEDFRSEFLQKRNAAIISIFAATGIRIEEFENIKIGDVRLIRNAKNEPSHFELSVSPVKQSNARTVPFADFDSEDLCTNSFLRYYMWVLNETNQGKEKPLFWSSSRHGYDEERDIPFHRSGVKVMLDAVKKKAYLERNISVHQFRHYYATYSIINGIDIIELQRLMGHSRITTTMRYIHIASRISGKLKQYSPVRTIKTKKHQSGYTGVGKVLFKH